MIKGIRRSSILLISQTFSEVVASSDFPYIRSRRGIEPGPLPRGIGHEQFCIAFCSDDQCTDISVRVLNNPAYHKLVAIIIETGRCGPSWVLNEEFRRHTRLHILPRDKHKMRGRQESSIVCVAEINSYYDGSGLPLIALAKESGEIRAARRIKGCAVKYQHCLKVETLSYGIYRSHPIHVAPGHVPFPLDEKCIHESWINGYQASKALYRDTVDSLKIQRHSERRQGAAFAANAAIKVVICFVTPMSRRTGNVTLAEPLDGYLAFGRREQKRMSPASDAHDLAQVVDRRCPTKCLACC